MGDFKNPFSNDYQKPYKKQYVDRDHYIFDPFEDTKASFAEKQAQQAEDDQKKQHKQAKKQALGSILKSFLPNK